MFRECGLAPLITDINIRPIQTFLNVTHYRSSFLAVGRKYFQSLMLAASKICNLFRS